MSGRWNVHEKSLAQDRHMRADFHEKIDFMRNSCQIDLEPSPSMKTAPGIQFWPLEASEIDSNSEIMKNTIYLINLLLRADKALSNPNFAADAANLMDRDAGIDIRVTRRAYILKIYKPEE